MAFWDPQREKSLSSRPLFSASSKAIVWGMQPRAVQVHVLLNYTTIFLMKIPYSGLHVFLRCVYFSNFKIAAIREISFCEIDRKPHHIPSAATSWKFSFCEIREYHPSKITRYTV